MLSLVCVGYLCKAYFMLIIIKSVLSPEGKYSCYSCFSRKKTLFTYGIRTVQEVVQYITKLWKNPIYCTFQKSNRKYQSIALSRCSQNAWHPPGSGLHVSVCSKISKMRRSMFDYSACITPLLWLFDRLDLDWSSTVYYWFLFLAFLQTSNAIHVD